MQFRFSKTEKLKSRAVITRLFTEGRSMKKYPVRLLYLPVESAQEHQAAFSVPKRNFKKAVERNLIKRRLREAYRLQKHQLQHNNGKKFALLFIVQGNQRPSYELLQQSVEVLLNRLKNEIT